MTSSGPERLCPSRGTAVDGGLVGFWLSRCGRRVQAADLDVRHRSPGPWGRAV
jgi:hypothetical protein